MKGVKEGEANITLSDGVFYNPKMTKLRDISVAMLRALDLRGAEVLDCTAATGVRGIRYALEAGAGEVTFLDMNEAAAKCAKKNVASNGLRCIVLNKSVQEFANTTEKRYDVIDLDPFGSPAPMLYDALKLAKDGSVFMVTATDTAVLCGAQPSACIKIYGATPLHVPDICQEAGARLLLGYIARTASQFNLGVEPLLTLADMHYMRAFVRLRAGAKEAVTSAKSLGAGRYCVKCGRFECRKGLVPRLEERCKHAGDNTVGFGPLWLGALKDDTTLNRMSEIAKGHYPGDAYALISQVKGELGTPLFYSVPRLTRYLGMSSISPALLVKKLGAKHHVSTTHFAKSAIKTDATHDEVVAAVKSLRA